MQTILKGKPSVSLARIASLAAVLRVYWVVVLGPVLLLGPLFIRGQVLFWGTPSLQFVAWWVQASRALSQGSLPLWNPLNGLGAPFLANYQMAFFYPPNWLLLLTGLAGAAGVAVGFLLLAVLHLGWGGLGMAFLLRRLEFPWLGQVLGGLAYGLSGYLVGRLGFYSMVWAAAWLPWVIYYADMIASPALRAAEGEAERPSRLPLLIPGLVTCTALMLLAGHAQLAWYTLLLAGLWVAAGGLRLSGIRGLLGAWARLAVAVLLAAAIAAVQLLPTLEYLRQSSRADAYAYEEALTYSFWPWRLLTLALPDFFGNPAAGDFWGYGSYWEDHLYTGMLPLLLALATLYLAVKGLRRSGRTERWPLVAGLWGLLVISVLLALGKNTPLFPFLYKSVPTFAMFQAPARYLIWAAFAIPILGAVAVERWRSPTGRGLYWFRLGTAGAFAVTLGAFLAVIFLKDIRLTFIRATALAGLWALGFGLLTLLIPFARKYNRVGLWQAAVIVWTLADLLFTGWSLNPGGSLDFYENAAPLASQVRAAAGEGRFYLSRAEEYDLKFLRFLRFRSYQPVEDWRGLRAALIPNLNLLDGLSSANNFDPLVPARYARWMETIETLSPTQKAGWLALMGVGAVEHIDVSQPYGVRFDPVKDALRFRWFACVQPVQVEAQAWQAIDERIASNTDPLSAPLILEGWSGPSGNCQADARADIRLVRESPDQLVLQVTAPEAGWLMVADTFYPGWQARNETGALKIYAANGLFRGIALPAGSHQILIFYRPIGFYFGVLFSILGLLCITLFWRIRGRGLFGVRFFLR